VSGASSLRKSYKNSSCRVRKMLKLMVSEYRGRNHAWNRLSRGYSLSEVSSSGCVRVEMSKLRCPKSIAWFPFFDGVSLPHQVKVKNGSLSLCCRDFLPIVTFQVILVYGLVSKLGPLFLIQALGGRLRSCNNTLL
jgi:hypothetical protein